MPEVSHVMAGGPPPVRVVEERRGDVPARGAQHGDRSRQQDQKRGHETQRAASGEPGKVHPPVPSELVHQQPGDQEPRKGEEEADSKLGTVEVAHLRVAD